MIGHDVAAAVPLFRAQSESLMVDTVLIERKSGTHLDPDTLEQVDTWETVYSGRCKRRPMKAQDRQAVAGETDYPIHSFYLDLPVSDASAHTVRDKDRATVTPGLTGLPVVVATLTPVADGSHAYELRFIAEEVGEWLSS